MLRKKNLNESSVTKMKENSKLRDKILEKEVTFKLSGFTSIGFT